MITKISEDEFYEYNVIREPLVDLFATEKSWYKDDEDSVLGLVLMDKTDKDWGYVILGRNENDEYRAIKTMVSYDTKEEAQEILRDAIQTIVKDGKVEEPLFHSSENIVESSNVIVTDINNEIKSYLKKHPEKLYELTPRKFEELIASIMIDFGFDVELTKATRDGGKDIIATIKNSVTSFLAYIECKKYSPNNKIGVEIIRNVSGVHYLKKPSKSIIVTTSFFTKDAIQESRMMENQLDLKDFDDIKEWLNKY